MSAEPPSPTPLAERVRRFGETAILTRANVVTIARLVFTIPVLALILDEGSSWLTFSGWFVLSVTDGLDGWIARRDGTTRSGAFLDPLADKVLVLGGFFSLAIDGSFAWLPVIIVAVRELGMTYSSFMSGLKRAQIEIDRKVLADLAVRDKAAFSKIASQVKASLAH